MASVYTYIATETREGLVDKGKEVDGYIRPDGTILIFHHGMWVDDPAFYKLKEQTK